MAKETEKKVFDFNKVSANMVNGVKAQRAYNAVIGKAKGGTVEVALVQRLASDFPDREDLMVEVYKGLGGLLNAEKAKVNRANEEKDRKRKASR